MSTSAVKVLAASPPTLRERLASLPAARMFGAWLAIVMFGIVSLPAQAQSVGIGISPEDLDEFFTWFNTMFGVILPIALIGAGLVAGATFAFVVGNMLKKAFQSLSGGG